ncbi:MAG: T9SS type A sorting domain-containing protein [Saprospiraceae bacterium]|nr:T9SS type A sorting domain-containing protein [Saprospiraceae bacterium]
MYKIFLLSLLTLASFVSSAQTPFTVGNIVVVRVGDGAAALSNQSIRIALVEMTPTGTVVQTINLPYSAATETGGNNKICTQGSSSNDVNLTVSGDGRYFVMPGYNSDEGVATVSGAAGIKRVFCRIAMDGTWDTKTLMDDANSTGNARCAATNDGSGFWLAGSSLGVRYTPYGSTGAAGTTTLVSTTVTNMRTIQAFGGNLVVGTGSGTAVRAGTISGFPTTTGNTMVTFPGVPTTIIANSIYMTNVPGGPSGLNTMYIASDATPAGIHKYCLNSGTGNWDLAGTIETAINYRGLTGSTSGSNVTLFAIRGGSPLVSVVDNTGFNQSPSALTPTTISTAPTNMAYRGVQFVKGNTIPVGLLSFTAAKNDNTTANILTWATASEVNNKGFEVEKSSDGLRFEKMGFVAGNNKASTYQFLDNLTSARIETSPTFLTYYRLRQIDNDGKETLSKVITIEDKGAKGKLAVFPNPVSNLLTVENTEGGNFQIFNLLGQQVLTGKTPPSGAGGLDVSALPQGTYILKVGAEQAKFIKQ